MLFVKIVTVEMIAGRYTAFSWKYRELKLMGLNMNIVLQSLLVYVREHNKYKVLSQSHKEIA